MRIEKNHAHAYTRYRLLSWKDYFLLLRSVIECKIGRYKSLTVHLPYEIQHNQVKNIVKARKYIFFGEFLKKIFRINFYWENAPWLNNGSWTLKFGNTNWSKIPNNIDICLDTGHLMLGCKTSKHFKDLLNKVLSIRGKQVKHLHLHENNFVSDQHILVPGRVITKSLFKYLIKGKSYIVEKGE